MKEIYHARPGGRHFSPLMPGDRYLNLRSRNHLRAGVSENIVRYETLLPRPEVVRSFSSLYENKVIWVLFLTMSKFIRTQLFDPFGNFENDNFSLHSKIFSRMCNNLVISLFIEGIIGFYRGYYNILLEFKICIDQNRFS